MPLLATIALAAAGATLPACSWDRPGVNPFMGDVVAAVDRYKDIPEATRTRLKDRMQRRSYDEIVSIRREAISGKARYASEIRDMHFGAGSVCTTVTRTKWTAQTEERGLVYCEDGQCILVPTVCRNVSRIRRLGLPPAEKVAAAEEPQTELEMDPTSAGVPNGAAPSFVMLTSAQPQAAGDFGLPSSLVPVAPLELGNSLLGPHVGSLAVPTLPPGLVIGRPTPPAVTPSLPLPPAPLPPVPEPSSWALFLAGLAAVSFVVRRRS
jgi:hypothetical protein